MNVNNPVCTFFNSDDVLISVITFYIECIRYISHVDFRYIGIKSDTCGLQLNLFPVLPEQVTFSTLNK